MDWETIPQLVRWAGERFGAAEAVADGEERLSFAELAASVDRASRAMAAAGIRRGDRVGIWAPNRWEWIVAALGVHGAGGVLVPVNTRFKGREAADVLGRSGAKLLFCVGEFLGTDYVRMLEEAGRPSCIDRVVELGSSGWEAFLEGEAEPEEPGPEDLCDIMFTSGTTGRPKGATSTHRQTLRTFDVWSRVVGLGAGDRYLVVNPFFHTFGYKAGFLACLMRGTVVLPQAVFDVRAVLERIERERVTVLPGPPTLYQSVLEHPGSRDLGSLRLAVTGAAVVPVELIRRMREELGFETVLTAYGLTEATGVVTMCRADDDAATIAATSGCAIPGVEVRVVDDDGREVERGRPGEVVVRGYNVTPGYWGDPEATAETIRDGWLHTGDVGVMDERGYLRITDRKKDMFIVGGFNAYPAEIENDLLRHPSVAQAAVVGVPDERLGEVGYAFLVPRHGARIEPGEIIDWARREMANYKVPRHVEVVDGLPLNASGKVLRYELRDLARARVEVS